MAHITLDHPVREIHGAYTPKGIVNRQKKFRDENGRIISEGRQEAYTVTNPRDWKKNPAQGAELEHQNRWREACHRTSQIIQAAQTQGPDEKQQLHRTINNIPDYYTPEEAISLYNSYKERFNAQLPDSDGKHPDPQAPIDTNTKKEKRYTLLPAFIRAMIYNQLKSQL